MKYRPYRLNMEKIVKFVRKSGLIKLPKTKTIKVLQKAVSWIYSTSPIMGSLEATIHAEELNWLNSGKIVYFPEDLEMAQNIMHGAYTITTEDALYDGNESFVLNLPDGLAFDNNDKGSGLLVTVMSLGNLIDILDTFTDWANIKKGNVTTRNDNGSFTISIDYQSVFNSEDYHRVSFGSFGALEALKMNDVNDYINSMTDRNASTLGLKLTQKEYAYQFEMIRLVCGFLVYKKALPDRIISGLPGINHKEVETPLTKNQEHHIIHRPKGGTREVTGGYRTWHFRQLMNERYYRGEHANKAKGSRVIFVSESYTVQDVDAKTVLTK